MAAPIPEGYSAVTPYLTIAGAAQAIDFYKQALGAEELLRMTSPDGRIGHAEVRIGDSRIMLSDEYPDMGCRAPDRAAGSPVSIMLYVEDVDTVVARAVAAGATVQRPVADMFYGDRMGTIIDPFGHRWHIGTHIEDVPPDELERRAQDAMAKG